MMLVYFNRAIKDIFDNRFLNIVTVITIAISILIASAFFLFFINANDIVSSWRKGIRLMVYLKPGTDAAGRIELKRKIKGVSGVQEAIFISKETALTRLREQMQRQASLFENLKENPLPDAFEIRMVPDLQEEAAVERVARQIESLPRVDDVEYGQLWFKRFTNVINLFRLTGYALGGLFFMAAVFIVANTIRIVLYSRREEIEIMRLVGAAGSFIRTPFYIEGVILGALGGIIGLMILLILFIFVTLNFEQSLADGIFQLRFLPFGYTAAIILGSMLVGWLGCYLSLKQFLKI
jgi:cell division transport system permease protein